MRGWRGLPLRRRPRWCDEAAQGNAVITMPPTGALGLLHRVWDGLHRRCPVCRIGRIFGGAVKMNAQCPTCRYVFEREPGYFLGAIAIGYFMGVGIVCALAEIGRAHV